MKLVFYRAREKMRYLKECFVIWEPTTGKTWYEHDFKDGGDGCRIEWSAQDLIALGYELVGEL